jgi:hypothetical protein
MVDNRCKPRLAPELGIRQPVDNCVGNSRGVSSDSRGESPPGEALGGAFGHTRMGMQPVVRCRGFVSEVTE